jgi:hypothetical protein
MDGARRRLRGRLGRGDQVAGGVQVGLDLRVYLVRRGADRLRCLLHRGNGSEPERHAAPELHQVVVVEGAEEVRLPQDLVLLGLVQVGEGRHPEQDQVHPVDPIVDRVPDIVHRGVVGPHLIGIRLVELGQRPGMLGVVGRQVTHEHQVPVVIGLELERVVGADQRRAGALGVGDSLVLRHRVHRGFVKQGVAAGQ